MIWRGFYKTIALSLLLFSDLILFSPCVLGGDQNIYKSLAGQSSYDVQHFEVHSGVDVTPESWFFYTTGILAPLGQYYEEGPRLRLFAGYGQHGFEDLFDLDDISQHLSFDGEVYVIDAMLGYAFVTSQSTLKLYAGVSYKDYLSYGRYDGDISLETREGFKTLIESWFNLGKWGWLSADGSYSSVNRTYSLRPELGWRVFQWASVGIEAGHIDSRYYDEQRIGGFIDFYVEGTDIGISAGLSDPGHDESGPYMTLNVTSRF